MSDLFENLNHIADGRILATQEELLKAFQDAGYNLYNSKYVSEHERRQGGYMTGQEWYDRFEKEVRELPQIEPDVNKLWLLLQQAAKRAAGLPE